jgi:hypothetical protein
MRAFHLLSRWVLVGLSANKKVTTDDFPLPAQQTDLGELHFFDLPLVRLRFRKRLRNRGAIFAPKCRVQVAG